jgi:hypothetical protein
MILGRAIKIHQTDGEEFGQFPVESKLDAYGMDPVSTGGKLHRDVSSVKVAPEPLECDAFGSAIGTENDTAVQSVKVSSLVEAHEEASPLLQRTAGSPGKASLLALQEYVHVAVVATELHTKEWLMAIAVVVVIVVVLVFIGRGAQPHHHNLRESPEPLPLPREGRPTHHQRRTERERRTERVSTPLMGE